MFPDIPFVEDVGTSIPESTLEATQALKEFPTSKFPAQTILGYGVVICIAYQPSFRKTVYDTAYVLDLFHTENRQLQTMFKIGEDIDASRLMLRLHPLGGIQAN